MTRSTDAGATAPLADLTDAIQYGYTAKSSLTAEGPRYLRITDIQDDRVQWSLVPRTTINEEFLERYRLQRGDIVFARTGATVGKSFLICDEPENTVFASYLIRVRCNADLLDPEYAAYYFKSTDYWSQILEGATGTGQPNFNGTKLGDLKVPVKTIPAQRRIVAKLDSLFARSKAAREELGRVPKLVERYKQGVLAAAFRGELTKDDPTYWRTLSLGELITSIQSGKNLRCEERPPRPAEQGIVKISSVSWGQFDPRASKTVLENTVLDQATLIRSGDFLISRANTLELVGACVVVNALSATNLYLSDKVLRLCFNQPVHHWIKHYLDAKAGREQIEQLATGNQLSMRNISQAAIRSIRVPLPDECVRSRIVTAIDRALRSCTQVLQERSRADDLLDRFDQASLAMAFRGELVGSSAADTSVQPPVTG